MNERDLAQLDMMEEQAGWLGIRAPETAPPDEGWRGQVVVWSTIRRWCCTRRAYAGSICLHFAPLKLLIAGHAVCGALGGRIFREEL